MNSPETETCFECEEYFEPTAASIRRDGRWFCCRKCLNDWLAQYGDE